MSHCNSEEEHEQHTLQSMHNSSSQNGVPLKPWSVQWHWEWRGKTLQHCPAHQSLPNKTETSQNSNLVRVRNTAGEPSMCRGEQSVLRCILGWIGRRIFALCAEEAPAAAAGSWALRAHSADPQGHSSAWGCAASFSLTEPPFKSLNSQFLQLWFY